MSFDFASILRTVPAAIIGLTVHEYSHALMSHKLGDPTAKAMGRLSLNPLKHIDPLGLLLIVVAGFGWAKPVLFNPAYLKKKNRDEILIALAGPVSNLIMGTLLFATARILYILPLFNNTELGFGIVNMLLLWGTTNFGLFVFNLIPIPPLDGSHLYTTFLQEINPDFTAKLYRIGMLVLLAVILIENQTNLTLLPVMPAVRAIAGWLLSALRFNA